MSGLSKDFASPSVASTSQEGQQSRRLKVTLLSSEWSSSTDGDVSTISRELAIQLAKFSNVEVSVFLPQCSDEDRRNAASRNVQLIEAEEMVGMNPVDWLAYVPHEHEMHCVLGHGVTLGKQVQFIKKVHLHCKWIQVVHTTPEELGIYRQNISEGEKQQKEELKLCHLADEVVAIGPKLADAYKRYLRSVKKKQNVFDLTPGIFSEFLDREQAAEERRTFCVLVIGSGNSFEDFNLKGLDIAVKAIVELNDPSCQLWFVCSSREKGNEVAEKLLQHGISRNQLIVRSSNDSREVLADLFYEVDLAMMPSRTEGFGLPALEALSALLPVLVSGNSGLGVALKQVPLGSQCVLDSEDPKDWAREIKAVRQKRRDVRLSESKLLREHYAKTYDWEKPCNVLVKKMQTLAFGSSESRTLAPVMKKRPASVAETSQAYKRPREEFTEDTYHKVDKLNMKIDVENLKPEEPDLQTTTLATESGGGQNIQQPRASAAPTATVESPSHLHLGDLQALKEEVFLTFALNYMKSTPPTNKEERNELREYLVDMKVLITGVSKGSLVITVQCESLQILEELWKDYSSGYLGQVVQNCLVTEKILKELNLAELKLKTVIDIEEYKACKVYFEKDALRALEGSTSCHLQDSSGEYGQFPVLRATEKPTYQSGHTQISIGHGLSVFTELLKAEYNRRSLLKPLYWENTFKLPLEDVYMRLSVVSRRKTNFVLEDRTVHMYDIFKNLNKDDDSMVLVEGSPGIEKTTFCLKISHDWANQKIPVNFAFPDFKLVLLLKCRDIHGDVKEAIVDQLLPEDMDEKAKKKLIDYIEDVRNQESVLIILDGLDELPEAGRSHVDKLLYRRILSRCYVLATSRQDKGIEVRQKVDFGVLLQIEGFTEADSFEYIRKHFIHLGPDHVAKGERLIQSIKENTFLHELPNNPLSLLHLCVVFEYHEGNLPSSRTELYDIIVRCLLRRYCAKSNVKAATDDKALEEQFKDSLLALGQLAWRCLLEDRFSFREEELAEFERTMKSLAARKLGLVFKEASLRKINPQHEYHFFHKTFQEYLAALYLAHKLLREKVNVFRDLKLSFWEITTKYKQVFIFVCGALGKDAATLFDHIGEHLQMTDWDWLECRGPEATFFIECFSENRNAEQMAMNLCFHVPFPQSISINYSDDSWDEFLSVANACKSFTQLQLPFHFIVSDSETRRDPFFDREAFLQRAVEEFLASYSRLETIVFSELNKNINVAPAVCMALRANSSLHSFTFERGDPFSSEEAVAIGNSLAASKTLQTVTLKLPCELGENWMTVLEGLSGDTPLTSVVLEINGSVRESEKKTLKSFLSKRSLKSLSLAICGDMRDSLATSIGEGLAADPCLQSLTLIVNGSLSCSAFSSLKKGVLKNSTLKSLELKVFGGLPDNWVNICEALYAAKMSSTMSLLIEPDTVSKITTAQVACLRPVLKKILGVYKLHSFTVNMWGELSCSGASDLCKLLTASRVSSVNLKIHGRVTDSVATCLVENFDKVNSGPLSDLSINIRGELTRDGNSTLQALKCNQTFSFTLNVQDVNAVDEICDEVKLFAVDSSSLKAAFTKFESICSRVSKLSLNLDNPNNSREVDWGCSVGDVLAKFGSLGSLSLLFNYYGGWNEGGLGGLWSGVAQNASITMLSITVNVYLRERDDEWVVCLYNSLKRNTSITTLSIIFNNYSGAIWNWKGNLCCGWQENTSITTLSITENIYSDLSGGDFYLMCEGPELNSSLTTLSIKVNNYKNIGELPVVLRLRGFKEKTVNLSVNSCGGRSIFLVDNLNRIVVRNTLLVTLNLALNSHSNSYEDCENWMDDLSQTLDINESPVKVCLEVNVLSEKNEKSETGLT